MDRLAAWQEWKERCAANLCGKPARQVLHGFAHARFLKFYPRSVPFHTSTVQQCAVTAPDAWHLFETYLATSHTRQGKCYKDWLFARVATSRDNPLDVIQGGATLIMRSVVRRHVHDEFSPKGHVSLQTVVSERGGQTLTLEDLLGTDLNPADAAAEAEYDRLAEAHAAEFFDEMPGHERVMLLAKAAGISLASAAVVSAAGRGKSALCATYHRFMRRIALSMVEKYPGEEKSAVMHLTQLTLHKIKKRTISWGKAEKRCAGFFIVAEEARNE